MESLIFYSCIFFFFFLISQLLFQNKKKKNKNNKTLPPAPPSLPILGHLHLLKSPLHRSLSALSHRYGPILYLRFGFRPVLVVSSPALAEECFTTNDIAFANRPRLFAIKYISFNYTSIAWSSYGPHWRNLRRISTVEILSSNRVQTFSYVRSEEIRNLAKELLRDSDLGKVELKSKFSDLTLNVVMRMIAGKRYGGEKVVDLDEATRFKEIIRETLALSGASNPLDFFPFLRWIGFKGVEKRLIRMTQKKDLLLQDLIEEHRRIGDEVFGDEGERKKTLIDVLLSLQQSDPEYYTDDIIKGLVMVK